MVVLIYRFIGCRLEIPEYIEVAMNNILTHRLNALSSEKQKGLEALAEIDGKRARLTETLLRIEGAMAVLREVLAEEPCEQGREQGGEVDVVPQEPLRQVSP